MQLSYKGLSFIMVLLGVLMACQPEAPRATFIPFPTMTAGALVEGRLPQNSIRPVIPSGDGLSNPATAVALINEPTPTPRYDACPASNSDATLPDDAPETANIENVLLSYLSSGGNANEIEDVLLAWDITDETGYVRDNVDLTGEGTPEIVLGYRNGDFGTLVIMGCREGQYVTLYRTLSDTSTIPDLIWLGDMNNAPPAEVVLAQRECANAEACEIATLLLSWNRQQGRFVNLLDEDVLTLDLPTVRDTDGDDVAEVVINLESRGSSATGPLRTGVNIYDWNGAGYTLSIIQLDAPRYHIQVIHEGDRLLARGDFNGAYSLYENALTQENLRYWFNDGPNTVDSYALYRQALTLAAQNNSDGLANIVSQLNAQYPVTEENSVEDLPVYVHMAYAFLNTLVDQGDLHLSCVVALEIADERSEALELLNRYGSRSPTYQRLDLCPF
jgi:hypothetical protein